MAKFSTGYTFGFATALCAALALAVASASMGLRPIQQVNERRDLQEKILGALGLPEDGSIDLQGEAIDTMYAERVEVIVVDDEGSVLSDKTLSDVLVERKEAKEQGREAHFHPVYLRKDGESVGAYAIEMAGKGLWGPVSGYLAIQPDGETVLGATFFAPKETPGLGYEITADHFTSQWVGKKIYGDGGARPIRVVKGAAELACADAVEYCVDGVSGATLTSNGVDRMVADAIETYNPYLERVRSGGGS